MKAPSKGFWLALSIGLVGLGLIIEWEKRENDLQRARNRYIYSPYDIRIESDIPRTFGRFTKEQAKNKLKKMYVHCGGWSLTRRALEGHTNAVNLLLQAGVNPNCLDPYGMPALMVATQQKKSEIMKMLIAAGADVNKRNYLGKTAFDLITEEDGELRKILDAGIGKPVSEEHIQDCANEGKKYVIPETQGEVFPTISFEMSKDRIFQAHGPLNPVNFAEQNEKKLYALQKIFDDFYQLNQPSNQVLEGSFSLAEKTGDATYIFIDDKLAVFEIHLPLKNNDEARSYHDYLGTLPYPRRYDWNNSGGLRAIYAKIEQMPVGEPLHYSVRWNDRFFEEFLDWKNTGEKLEAVIVGVSQEYRKRIEEVTSASLESLMPSTIWGHQPVLFQDGRVSVGFGPYTDNKREETYAPIWSRVNFQYDAIATFTVFNGKGPALIEACVSVPDVECQEKTFPKAETNQANMIFRLPQGTKGPITLNAKFTYLDKTETITKTNDWP